AHFGSSRKTDSQAAVEPENWYSSMKFVSVNGEQSSDFPQIVSERIIANSLVDGRLVPGCRSASRDLMTEKDPENNRHCGVYQDQSCRFCLNRP
ncbi:MAG: hypothetical protein WAV06_07550, partial [Terracidiphilus sp.]